MSTDGARSLDQRLVHQSRLFWVLALGVYLLHTWSYLFLNDDAYISFRYALHWIDHGEVTYNLGEYVEGYTNFLWVALLAMCYAFGAAIPTSSLVLSIFFSLALILLLTRSVRGLAAEVNEEKGNQSLVTVILLALSPSYACWSTGGLEVMLFSFTLSLGLILSSLSWGSSSESRRRTLGLGLGAGGTLALSAMTRPEGVMIFGLIGLYRLISRARSKAWLSRGDWAAVISFSALYLPYFSWRYHYYGYLFPNTYYAKVGVNALWSPGVRYIGEWLLFHPWLLSPFLWFALKSRRSDLRSPFTNIKSQTLSHLTLLCSVAIALHVARVGGDFMALHRFLVPLLPLSALVCSAYLIALLRELPSRKRPWVVGSLILILSCGAIVIHRDANRIGSRDGVDSIGWLRQFSEQCAQTGRYIDQIAPKEAKLATTAAGALPFYAKRYTLDLLGLNDEWIAHEVPARGQRPGHTKSAPFRYPIDKGVDYLIYHPTFTRLRPRASTRMSKALKPYGYRWQSYRVPGLVPAWWSVWTRHLSKD